MTGRSSQQKCQKWQLFSGVYGFSAIIRDLSQFVKYEVIAVTGVLAFPCRAQIKQIHNTASIKMGILGITQQDSA